MDAHKLLTEIRDAVIQGERAKVCELVEKALGEGIDPIAVFEEGLTQGIQEIGKRFGQGDAYLPELIMAADAMMAGKEISEQRILSHGGHLDPIANVLIGTVEGDIHIIGKDMLASIYRASSFNVIDLGVDVPSMQFVEKVKELKPDILALSALMTTTMIHQRVVIEMLKEAGVRGNIKILVGGAPVTPEWANEIGADGTAPDAVSAVQLSKKLVLPETLTI